MVDTISVGGGSLAAASQGDGEAVLFVHGALIADSFGLMLAAGDLPSTHRTITYHRRGFQGSSQVREGQTLADEADDALAVLDHYGVDVAHVVGHSYGGALALQIALQAPDRVHSLALFEPGVLSVPAAEGFAEGVPPIADKFQGGDHEGALLAFLELVGGDDPMSRLGALPPEANEQALADLATLFAGDLPALSSWEHSDEQLGSITQPALVVTGTASPEVFLQASAKVEGLLPASQPYALDGASHFLQMEQPAEAAAELTAFLGHHRM